MGVTVGLILLSVLCACVGGVSGVCTHVKNEDMIEYTCAGGHPADLNSLPEETGKIRIVNMQIPRITVDTFSRFGSELWVLSCSHCGIVDIEPGAFQKLENLQQLSLDSNLLSTVKEDWFKGLDYLTYLDLNYNRIRTIEEGVFKNLPSLVDLRLSGNRLECLNLEAMTYLGELRRIFLNENYEFKCPNAVSNFLENRGVNFDRDPEWEKIPVDLVPVQIPPESAYDQRTTTTPRIPTHAYDERYLPPTTTTEDSRRRYTYPDYYPTEEEVVYSPEHITPNWRTSPEPERFLPNYRGWQTIRPETSTVQSESQTEPQVSSSYRERYPTYPTTASPDLYWGTAQPEPAPGYRERYPVPPSVPSSTPNWMTTTESEPSTPIYHNWYYNRDTPTSTYDESRSSFDSSRFLPPVDPTYTPYITASKDLDITTSRSVPRITEPERDSDSSSHASNENENKHYEVHRYPYKEIMASSLAPNTNDHTSMPPSDDRSEERIRDPYEEYWSRNVPFASNLPAKTSDSLTTEGTDSTRIHVVRPLPPAGPEVMHAPTSDDFFQAPYYEPTVTIRPPPLQNYPQHQEETTLGVLSIETTTDKPLPECPKRNSSSSIVRSFWIVAISVLLVVMKNVIVERF